MIQKRWFRVEQTADGIKSCTRVEANGKNGGLVRYYEAVDEADACSQALAWYENRKETRAAHQRKVVLDRKSKGQCEDCYGRAELGKTRCQKHLDRSAELGRLRRDGLTPPRLPADPVAAMQAERIRQKEYKRADGGRCSVTWRGLIALFDEKGPVKFRDWLVTELDRRVMGTVVQATAQAAE